jgi:intraflagellar transport protein 74
MNEYGGLQKRHEILLNEVRALEGTLADYNLAMDKARVSTPPCHTVSSGP